MTRTVVITGVSGFVGTNVSMWMRDRGWTVVGLTRPDSRRTPPAGIRTVSVPLAEESLVPVFQGADVVVHLAGVVRAASREHFAAVNVAATREVARAAGRAGGHFIHISSQAAAGPGRAGRPRAEDDRPEPLTEYGCSKLEGEAAVRETPDLLWTILRPVAIYGPFDRGFLPVFRMARRGLFPIVGDPRTAYTLLHVDDLARAIEAATLSSTAAKQVFFIGNRSPTSTEQFLHTLADALNTRYRPFRIPDGLLPAVAAMGQLANHCGYPLPVDRARLSELTAGGFVCSVERAERLLGFRADVPLADGLARTAAWYRRHKWLAP